MWLCDGAMIERRELFCELKESDQILSQCSAASVCAQAGQVP